MPPPAKLLLLTLLTLPTLAQKPLITNPTYTAILTTDEIPRIIIQSHNQQFFRLPIISGLSTTTSEETLSNLQTTITHANNITTLTVTATSTLWTNRRFLWHFYPDHIDFQQFAAGSAPIARAYFFSNGISTLYAVGTSRSIASNTIIDADHYFAPTANFDQAFLHPIEQSQSLGIGGDPGQPSLSREQASGLYSPPPLFLAFGRSAAFGRGTNYASIGIGTTPGLYQFNGLQYSGEHFAGASFWVNYQGKLTTDNFASPVAAIHFGPTPIAALTSYTRWMNTSNFATTAAAPDVPWHHLPIFCGWGEQTTTANSITHPVAANSLATQENYTRWIATLDQRHIPASTIIIDDKWSTTYGALDIDTKKWPDMKAFVAAQHAHHRHVLLWVPVANTEGLPRGSAAGPDSDLDVTNIKGNPIAADVSNPRYEALLRAQLRHLVVDIGIDGFKEDWVGAPGDYTQLHQFAPLYGLEFVRRFQTILYTETHKWKPDALIETQTPNPLFRGSSDVLRLNDIYIGSRNVTQMMQARAAIAHAAGWALVDTDNAATTTLAEWWSYMLAQPTIGVPALYFVSNTTITHESPTAAQWSQLSALWTKYIAQRTPPSPDKKLKPNAAAQIPSH